MTQIDDCVSQLGRVFAEVPQTQIAVPTEKTAGGIRVVIVISLGLTPLGLKPVATYRTASVLDVYELL